MPHSESESSASQVNKSAQLVVRGSEAFLGLVTLIVGAVMIAQVGGNIEDNSQVDATEAAVLELSLVSADFAIAAGVFSLLHSLVALFFLLGKETPELLPVKAKFVDSVLGAAAGAAFGATIACNNLVSKFFDAEVYEEDEALNALYGAFAGLGVVTFLLASVHWAATFMSIQA